MEEGVDAFVSDVVDIEDDVFGALNVVDGAVEVPSGIVAVAVVAVEVPSIIVVVVLAAVGVLPASKKN